MPLFERWLFAPGSSRRLAAVRIGLCALLAERLARDVYLGLAGQPAALYRPLSFMKLLPAMPGRGVVIALQAVGIAAAVLAAIGFLARISLPVAWFCALFLDGMVTSTGKVVHNDVVLLLALVPLLAARTSDAWSIDVLIHRRPSGNPSSYGWPVRTAMVVVAGAYFFTGLSKLIVSGPAWATTDNLRYALYAASDAQLHANGLALFIADRPWLAHVAAGATLLFELSFPLVLWRPRLAWLYVPGAALLHLSIGAAMRLDYSVWAATAAVVLVDWPRVADRFAARRAVSSPGSRPPRPPGRPARVPTGGSAG